MIISASRRTDIPACFSDWFLRRINEGYLYVRNPRRDNQVWSISLSPDDVDGIVFWTKDPSPMLDKLSLLDGYMYYFQFTITPYGRDIERNLPEKKDIIASFRRLSDAIGPERVIWRYDPVLLSPQYSIASHIRAFERMAGDLSGYTERCVISFVDIYPALRRRMVGIREPSETEMTEIANAFGEIACSYGLRLSACAETMDLSSFGISRSCCIDGPLLEELLGVRLMVRRDRNQRPGCRCSESIDIGMYDTCRNGCLYCYAGSGRILAHDPESPMLAGNLRESDEIAPREMHSLKDTQLELDI